MIYINYLNQAYITPCHTHHLHELQFCWINYLFCHIRYGTTAVQVAERSAITQNLLIMEDVPFGMMKCRWIIINVLSVHSLASTDRWLSHSSVSCAFCSVPLQYLTDIEDHLGVTIPTVDSTFHVPVSEYDGKIAYGMHRKEKKTIYKGHVEELASSVAQLANMERIAQNTFLKMKTNDKWFAWCT